jgi:hypothetical protein
MAMRTTVGDVELSADITLGYATSFRLEDPDLKPGTPGGANPNSLGEGYWNDKGDQVSNVLKANAELGAKWKNYGAVATLNYFYDFEIMNADKGFHMFNQYLTGPDDKFANDTEDVSGSDLELLDGYVYGTYDFSDMAMEVRLGKQVINWGEGLFFVDGVSTQVPFNLAKLVLPGSEIKEAFIGLDGISVQLAPTDNLSLDAYYFASWEEHRFPGTGSFYGDDFFGPGTKESWAGAGPLLEYNFTGSINGVVADNLKRSTDEADDNGQFGISGRYLVGDLELGLYYSRHHEFFPQLATTAATAAMGSQYYEVFPEDVDMYGASFATTLGTWSFNGEIAYRPDRTLFTNTGVTIGSALYGLESYTGEEHDSIVGSVHGLGYYGGGLLGIDTNFYAVQLGWEHISGDTKNLQASYVVSRTDVMFDGGYTEADSDAFGVAAQWDATWQNAFFNGVDLTSSLFAQYDFSGYSHWWGNYAEGRLLTSLGLTADIGTAWEAGVTYARQDYDESHYAEQDTINFNVNYKF